MLAIVTTNKLKMTKNNSPIVLKGTTTYYEKLVPEIAERLSTDQLVFLHDVLMGGCQYNCLKCFSSSSKAYEEQLRERNVTVENLGSTLRRKLVKEAYSLGVRSIVIAGAGEPLMSKDLDTIIDTSSELGINPIVFTNGLLLDEKKAREYLSKGVSIIFSFDSINPDYYDILTGTRNNFKIAFENLKSALEIAESYSNVENGYKVVQLAVNTNPTILTYDSAEEIDEIGEIHELIQGKAAHFVSHPTPSGNAIKHWKLLGGTEELSFNPDIINAQRKYSAGLGGSSRRKDERCAYIHNGVVHFAGHWMVCPNQGAKEDFGRYPDVSVQEHFEQKKKFLMGINNPPCITRMNWKDTK